MDHNVGQHNTNVQNPIRETKNPTSATSVIINASSYAGNFKRHMKVHSGEKSNKCNQCDRAFSEASNLKTHFH